MRSFTWRRVALKVSGALALVLGLFALTVTTASAATNMRTAVAPPTAGYANQCPGDSAPSTSAINGQLRSGVDQLPGSMLPGNAATVASDGHCLKLAGKDGNFSGFTVVTSGDPVSIEGLGGWTTGTPLQIWASDPLPVTSTVRQWPLYLTQGTAIGPDFDINRECRSIIKGNKANPVEATSGTPAFGPFVYTAPDVPVTSIVNIRASIPNPDCTNIANAQTEAQGADTLLVVMPRPSVAQQCGLQAGPCLLADPVVGAGQTFEVKGYNYQVAANAISNQVYFYLTTDVKGRACNQSRGSTSVHTVTPQIAFDTPNFTFQIAAPPAPSLAGTTQDGLYVFQVVATTDPNCMDSTQLKAATIYVVPPVLTVPTELVSQQKSSFAGNSWLAGTVGNTNLPMQIGLFVGKQVSDLKTFDCAAAKSYTATSDTNGHFQTDYTAAQVDTGLDLTVLAVGYAGGSLAPNACQQAFSAACQAPNSDTTCPAIVLSAPLRIVPKAVPVPPWLVLLLGLMTLLALLFFLLWLGRDRDQKEVVITEQDITVVNRDVNAMASQQYADASFSRRIRLTRSVINVRTGKVIDQEVEEYDVFKDAQGREVRRLRPVAGAQRTSAPVTA